MQSLRELMNSYAHPGRVEWIGLRAARRAEMAVVSSAEIAQNGLQGDHGVAGKRAVTLIQAEYLPVISALCDTQADAAALRRNIMISGINLSALKGRQVMIGDAVLELTGICAPCSRMEETLGPGGYSAVRNHGGWCARVITPGRVSLGDAVKPV